MILEKLSEWFGLSNNKDPIEYIKSFQKLEIKEGDVIILKTSKRLSEAQYKNLKDKLTDLMKKQFTLDKIRIVVIEEGLDIGILRKSNDSYRE